MDKAELDSLTSQIIGSAFEVSCELGIGYVEKVYENALAHEMRKRGLKVQQQAPLQVFYDGILVGEFNWDILVEDFIIIELKAAKAINEANVAQCLNYLKTSGLKLALILNFGTSRVQIKRVVRDL